MVTAKRKISLSFKKVVLPTSIALSKAEKFFNLAVKFIKKNVKSPYQNALVGKAKLLNKFYKRRKKKKKKRRKGRIVYRYYNGRLLKCYDNSKYEFNTYNNSAKFMGLHAIRNGNRPQTYNKPNIFGVDFYHTNKPIFENFDIDISDDIIVNGNFETNKHTIQEQMDGVNYDRSVLPKKRHFKENKEVIKNVIRKMEIKTLPAPTKGEMAYTYFNEDTKPGIRYEFFFSKHKKKDCRGIAQHVANSRWDAIEARSKKGQMIKRQDISPSIYTIGARNKREEEPIDGELAKSRAIHMPEFHAELHAGTFSDRIMEHIKEEGRGPLYLGNSIVRYERFEKDINRSYCSVEGDWKKFDSTLTSFLLTSAVSIVRCYFRDGLDIDNHFLAILSDLVIKDYLLSGGRVYRIISGLPSGSKLTSLLGSVINLLMLNFVFSEVETEKLSFAVGGDDFVVFIKDEIKDLEKFEEGVYEKCLKWGIKLKFFKYKSHDPNCFYDFPVFYKYTVYKNKPFVPVENVIERTFSPWNKDYSKDGEILRLVWDLLGSFGPPSTSYLLVYHYMKILHKRIYNNDISLTEVIRYHRNISANIFYLRDLGLTGIYESKPKLIQHVNIDNSVRGDYLSKVFQIDCH